MPSHFYNRFILTSTVKSMNRAKNETVCWQNLSAVPLMQSGRNMYEDSGHLVCFGLSVYHSRISCVYGEKYDTFTRQILLQLGKKGVAFGRGLFADWQCRGRALLEMVWISGACGMVRLFCLLVCGSKQSGRK